jgi:hypothetical protein
VRISDRSETLSGLLCNCISENIAGPTKVSQIFLSLYRNILRLTVGISVLVVTIQHEGGGGVVEIF